MGSSVAIGLIVAVTGDVVCLTAIVAGAASGDVVCLIKAVIRMCLEPEPLFAQLKS